MGEKKIGFIPRVAVLGPLGPKEYGILITNERSIFVLESNSKAMLGGIIGGAIGAAIGDFMSSKKEIDYVHEPIEALASMKDSISVPHTSISSIVIKRKLSSPYLNIGYLESGRKKKIEALLTRPEALVTQKQIQGKSKKEILKEYAEEVWKAFERGLPPEAARQIQVRL